MIEGVSAKIRGGWSLWSCGVWRVLYGTVRCESATGGECGQLKLLPWRLSAGAHGTRAPGDGRLSVGSSL